MMKRCSTCKTEKSEDRFNKATHSKDGLFNQCKDCRKKTMERRTKEERHQEYLKNKTNQLDRDLFKHYGITRNQFNEMRIKQDFLCAICGRHESESHKGLHTDHCHQTKKIRGLLCSACNMGLGHFKDNVTLMTKAIKYLLGE